MCGIVSLFNPSSQIDETNLREATRAIKHRGPDGEKIWVSLKRNAGLGHRRLSIIDPEGGIQPFVNKENTVAVVVNGEFYGYKEIRSDLQSKGYKFQTQSDSEIILHLYEEYESDFLKFLRGEFAFIVYDDRKKRIFAGRDRFGIKPLQYSLDSKGTLCVASEAKAIFAAGTKPIFDRDALYHSFSLQYLPQDKTLFENVRQLKPGHTLTYDAAGLLIKKYWDLDFSLENTLDEKNYNEGSLTDDLEEKLIEAVSLRLQSDEAKYCCHLSGGIDSAMIAALAARVGEQKMHCFTVSFPHQSYDEVDLARKHAAYIGADFTSIPVDSSEIIETLSDAVFFSEGNAINSHLAAKFILNQKIKESGYKIALTGEGSDEVLGGYIHLKADLLGQVPEESKKIDNIVSGVHLPFGESLDLGLVKEKLGFIPAFLQAKGSIGYTMHSLLKTEFRTKYLSKDIVADFIGSLDVDGQLKGRSKVDQSTYIWTKFTLANYILKTLGDGTEMAHGIEGRVPFLDHIFFDFTKSLPPSLKIKGNVQKYILRKVAEKYVIKEIYAKPKQAFMAPPLSLMNDRKGLDFIRDRFSSRQFAEMEFFDQEKVLKIVDSLHDMDMNQQIALEPVIMLMLTTFLIGQRFNM